MSPILAMYVPGYVLTSMVLSFSGGKAGACGKVCGICLTLDLAWQAPRESTQLHSQK